VELGFVCIEKDIASEEKAISPSSMSKMFMRQDGSTEYPSAAMTPFNKHISSDLKVANGSTELGIVCSANTSATRDEFCAGRVFFIFGFDACIA